MIRLENIRFAYPDHSFQLALSELELIPACPVALIGPSGSGKTTLMHLISGILLPQTGTITIERTTINELNDEDRRTFRISKLGLVFQDFALLEYLNILENILLPCYINPVSAAPESKRTEALGWAEKMGLGGKLEQSASTLSQGERQRVAVCRALLTKPLAILADEPTGNLDPANKLRILDTLLQYSRSHNAVLFTITHDHALLDRFDRTIDLSLLSRNA